MDLEDLPNKLELRNAAYHEVVKRMETAINNVKVQKDKFRTQEFLEEVKRDLNIVMSLHYGQCNLRDAYVQMRKQNDKLYKENKLLKEAEKENNDN